MDAPVVTLRNGLRLANFSSPHSFTFDDGTELPPCSPERAERLVLRACERETDRGKWKDIALGFTMTPVVMDELTRLEKSDVDIILVPYPVMTALRECEVSLTKVRCVRMVDRVRKIASCDRFCI